MHPDVEAVAALSPMQQGLLFHSLLNPGAGVYVNQHVISLRGHLDPIAFERAWREIVRRHQIFRASFHWEQVDTAVMAIWREARLDVEVLDWRGAGHDEQHARLRAFLARDKQRGFELTAAPLMRLTVFRRSEEEWWCGWSNHHLVLDGWSAALVAREAFLAYAACREGRRIDLPAAPAFTDYLAWLARQDLPAAETFWRRELGDLQQTIATIAGALDARDDAGAIDRVSHGGGARDDQRRLRLSADESRTLQQGARRLSTTVSVLAQAAWALVVSHYTRESDIVTGVTSSGRPPELPDVESMAGLFINTLPLRLRVRRDLPLAALVAQAHEQNLRIRAVEFSPLASVQTWSGLPAGTPLFESIVVFENYPVDRLLTQTVAGLAIEDIEIDEATNYPLTVTIGPGTELLLQITFDTTRFGAARIERLLRHYRVALLACATQPDQRVGDLCLLDATEWTQVQTTRQGARVDVPLDACLHHWIERQVDRTPAATAVRFDGTALTYAALNARANRLAHTLIRDGVRPGMLVGVAMERSPELVIALLAILKAGGAYVPLDPEYPHDRLKFQIADAAAPVVLVQTQLADRFAALLDHAGSVTRVLVVDASPDAEDDTGDETACANPATRLGPEHPAYVIYTSGSTGQPKGVVNTHRAICNRLIWMQQAFPLDASDRVLQKTPYSFDVSVWEFFWPLMYGATLVVARPGGHRDAGYVADLIADERITTIHFVPPMLEAILEEPRFEQCVSLTRVICSGEALTWDLQQRFFDRSPAELHNLYGPTEAAVDVTWWACRPEAVPTAVPIGRPISNLEIFLLNEDRQPVPAGVPGELWIGGVGLAQGYWRRPSLSAERFAPHPFSREPGARLYRTGDLARYREDGAIEYLGRLDHQVKIRGYRIELGEIEAALTTHPAVRQAVVLLTGDGANRRLVACIALDAGGTTNVVTATPPLEDDLRAHLARTLPPYMVPDAIVRLDAFPLTHNGKVDRRALMAAAAPAFPAARAPEHVPPRTAIERELHVCWSDALQHPAIGVTDSFFELGGHSLLATRLVSRIRSKLGIDLPLRALFEAPTIERLARTITDRSANQSEDRSAGPSANASSAQPIVHVPRDGDLPLSFAQERLWYVGQLDASGIAYNIPLALDLDGPLDVEAFEASLRVLVARHEPLRTSVAMVDGSPAQRVHPDVPFHLDWIDLSEVVASEQETRLAGIAERITGRPFDLQQPPLLRAALVRLDDERYRFLLAVHHLIADGASIAVLAHELTVCYAALRSGGQPQLRDLPWQYVDYAQWERDRATARDHGDDTGAGDMDVWVARLRDTPRLALPYDRARPAVQTFRGGVVVDVVPADVVRRVQTIGATRQASPFATLLAAFTVLLARVTGQQDICVGTPIRNRPRAELDGLVGLFVNTVALRTRVDLRESFSAHLDRTREIVLDAQERGHVPFDRIIDALQLTREPSRQPLVDVMFLLADSPIGDVRLADVRVRPVDVATANAKFDLLVACELTAEGLRVSWELNSDLFDAATIARLAGTFGALLQTLAAMPDAPLWGLDILSASERHQLLGPWAGESAPLPEPALVDRLFEAWVHERPSAIAIVSAEETLTYAELDRRADACAAALISAGVAAGDHVAIAVERHARQIVALLGILKAGAAYVPLDETWPPARLRHVLDDTDARLIIVDEAGRRRLYVNETDAVCDVPMLSVDRITEAVLPGEHVDAGLPQHAREARDADLAYILYTSGSTGEPKGVAIAHRAIVRLVSGQGYTDLSEGRRILVGAPLAFDASTFEIWGPLLSGGACVLLPPGVPTPDAIRRAITREHADTAWLTAALFNTLVDESPDVFAGLRQVLTGGEALSVRHVRAFRAAHPACRLVNGYGPTESTTFATFHDVGHDVAHEVGHQVGQEGASLADAASIPIGRPLANTRTYVLDDEMMLVPVGIVGELYLGGDGLARGYWRKPDLTARSFVPNPFGEVPGDRLYRTGDLVRRRADGALDFVGRADDQVKIRGHRIELGEVEQALRASAGVQAGAVVAERRAAGADERLVAYYVPETIPSDEVRRDLETRLPAYMVPSAYVGLARLPLTPQGKVDRRRLPRPVEGLSSPASVRAPATATEQAIARIWRDVLGVAEIGGDDNFFTLGGDSLASLRVCERARHVGLSITLAQMRQHQTVASLARVATTAADMDTAAPHRAVARRGRARVPLSASQHFFFEFAARDLHHYNLAQLYELHAPFSMAQLHAVVHALSARHDALRLRFQQAQDGWRAEVIDVAEVADGGGAAVVVDHAELADRELEAALAREAERWQASLDLTRGPLFRLVLVQRGRHRPARLFAIVHHLAADGASLWALHHDLQHAIAQVLRGDSIQLAPSGATWAQWVDRLAAGAGGAAARDAFSYWLGGPSAPLRCLPDSSGRLPRDHATGANTQASERDVVERWSTVHTDALLEVAARAGVEIGHLVLAAVARAVAAWTGAGGALVDWVAHGRDPIFADLDVSRTVGYFSTRTPLWLVEHEGALTTLAGEARRQLQQLPLGMAGFGLLRYLSPDEAIRRAMAALPTPEISVNYLGRHLGVFRNEDRRDQVLTPTDDPVGSTRAATQERPRLIRVLADIADRRLRITWKFSEHVHDVATIESLAASVSGSLLTLLEVAAGPGREP